MTMTDVRRFSFKPVLRAVALAGCVIAGHPGCGSSRTEPQTSTETHFLRYCDGDCGRDFDCVCGVCTRACTGTLDCSDLTSNTQCVPVTEGPALGSDGSCQQGATCDVTCTSRADCSTLGDDYDCDGGYCRKGNVVCPLQPLSPGDETREIVVGDMGRTYTWHIPSTYFGTSPVSLVLDFHPMDLGPEWEQSNSGFRELSDQEGFIVVWPHGVDTTWNLGPCCTASRTVDDLAFARAIVRQLSTHACIDPRRVYAVGTSIGAGMAYYLACQESEVFAAVAASSWDLLRDSDVACQPSRPVSEISFRGTDDTIVPYAGGATSPPGHPDMSMEVVGAEATFEKWASLDNCVGTPSTADANGCSTYSDCQDGAEVTLCSISGAGQTTGDATLAWGFLKRHPMP